MIIEVSGLVKRYGAITALDNLCFSVAEGCIHAFLGPNGAGKTTTVRILNSLTRADAGMVSIAGMDLLRDEARVKRLCGMAPQNSNLDGELTVAQNLDFHGRLYGMPRTERRSRAEELLEYVDMGGRAGSLVKGLSGGLKRRLMLARALLHRPRLLFLDEPTAGLDPAIRRRIWSLIRRIRQEGVTVFLTTHYIEEAEMLADRVGFVSAGRLVAEGAPAELTAGLGEWAVDSSGGDAASRFFADREAANIHAAAAEGGAAVRRLNLEDAFIALTGERVG